MYISSPHEGFKFLKRNEILIHLKLETFNAKQFETFCRRRQLLGMGRFFGYEDERTNVGIPAWKQWFIKTIVLNKIHQKYFRNRKKTVNILIKHILYSKDVIVQLFDLNLDDRNRSVKGQNQTENKHLLYELCEVGSSPTSNCTTIYVP